MRVLEALHEEGATVRALDKGQSLDIAPMVFVHLRRIDVVIEIVKGLESHLAKVRLPGIRKNNPIHLCECLSNNTLPVSNPLITGSFHLLSQEVLLHPITFKITR